jgi:hypothetical protein
LSISWTVPSFFESIMYLIEKAIDFYFVPNHYFRLFLSFVPHYCSMLLWGRDGWVKRHADARDHMYIRSSNWRTWLLFFLPFYYYLYLFKFLFCQSIFRRLT